MSHRDNLGLSAGRRTNTVVQIVFESVKEEEEVFGTRGADASLHSLAVENSLLV